MSPLWHLQQLAILHHWHLHRWGMPQLRQHRQHQPGHPTPSVASTPMGYPATSTATSAQTGNPAFIIPTPTMISSLASPATLPASPSILHLQQQCLILQLQQPCKCQ